MVWVIFTRFLALVNGLTGWTLGGKPSAIAFTIFGAFVAVGIRDLTQHTHAIPHNYPLIGWLRYGIDDKFVTIWL